MKLSEIIAIANRVYPDGAIQESFEAGLVGDGLAEFIVNELKETYNSKASGLNQLEEANRVMSNAVKELEAVRDAFYTG